MAKVTVLPDRGIIDQFAGVLDFYTWMGIPCVRKWPVLHVTERTAAVRAMWPFFRYINQVAGTLPPYIVQQWQSMIEGSNLTWKDMINRAYLGHTYNPAGYPKNLDYYNITDRFVIRSWTTWQDAEKVYLDLTTDVECVLWIARLWELPTRKVAPRIRRGNPNFLDTWLNYKIRSWVLRVEYPPGKNHHLWFYKRDPEPYYGTLFHARHNNLVLASLSQYFSPQDLGLA